ncbi:MAG: hypothetical protein PW734_11310 [Verrucomicrobium sp.]|nr:hypothetical protein [Verrucomicrobium sp.]
MEEPALAFLRALLITALIALTLAAFPGFRPECQPFGRRFSWFFVRYAFPYYCMILGIRLMVAALHHGTP